MIVVKTGEELDKLFDKLTKETKEEDFNDHYHYWYEAEWNMITYHYYIEDVDDIIVTTYAILEDTSEDEL